MANSALSLSQLSQIALVSGLDVGFNAVEVELWLDSETCQRRISVKFGDQKMFRRPCLRTPCEWALSYALDSPCIREAKIIEIPESALYEASYDLQNRFTSALLEVA